jgi:anti-sigma factor RsiW
VSRVEELSCQELVELVTDYLERALPASQARRFEEHLSGCPGCTVYLDQIRRTIDLTGRLTPEQLAPEVEEALLTAFRDWKSGADAAHLRRD